MELEKIRVLVVLIMAIGHGAFGEPRSVHSAFLYPAGPEYNGEACFMHMGMQLLSLSRQTTVNNMIQWGSHR